MSYIDPSEPPLGRFGGFFVHIGIFSQILALRLRAYAACVWAFFGMLVRQVTRGLNNVKRYGVRLILYKGGYFHQTHRLGLAAIASTTMLSLISVPMFNPLTQLGSASVILAKSSTNSATTSDSSDSLVLSKNYNTQVNSKGDEAMRNEVVEYVVEGGDTVSTIAQEYLVSSEALKYANNLGDNDLLHPGDKLKIPPVGGLVHNVDAGETISTIASLYQVSPQTIVDFNHMEEPYIIHNGQELVIPDAKVPAPKPKVAGLASQNNTKPQTTGLVIETLPSNGGSASGTGALMMPANGTLTQYFWWGHTAIDIANGCGTPIVAADSGTITFTGWWAGGGGNSVFVDHGNGYETKYAHLSGFTRGAGAVNKGDIIGYMGATGRAYGCHLHFIVTSGGRPINPLSVL
jgi:murein DD-endopeptidase MepM/ murein hydrolase activator NlpD